MISVTEYTDHCEVHDLDTNQRHHVALADLPVLLKRLDVDPRPLTPDEIRWLKVLDDHARHPECFQFDPEFQGVFVRAHEDLAAQLFRDWIRGRRLSGTVTHIKVAFEAASHRYAGGVSRIRELLEEAGYDVVGDRVRMRKAART
ncbi:MAG: hypothetical protein ABSG86_17970 [Thermoguttaceae bacterium]